MSKMLLSFITDLPLRKWLYSFKNMKKMLDYQIKWNPLNVAISFVALSVWANVEMDVQMSLTYLFAYL